MLALNFSLYAISCSIELKAGKLSTLRCPLCVQWSISFPHSLALSFCSVKNTLQMVVQMN